MILYAEIDSFAFVLVHADAPLGDGRTLCGLPIEGPPELSILPKGQITCRTCWKIIAHCKAIPARAVAYPVGRPNNPKGGAS